MSCAEIVYTLTRAIVLLWKTEHAKDNYPVNLSARRSPIIVLGIRHDIVIKDRVVQDYPSPKYIMINFPLLSEFKKRTHKIIM